MWGIARNATSTNKSGLYGINTGVGHGVYASSTSGRAACFAINNSLSGKEALWVQNSGIGWTGYFKGLGTQSKGVYIKTASAGQPALLVEGGTKSAVVPTSQGRKVLYAEEASEVYFSDYGFGRLKNGRAVIPIDLLFAETVNLAHPYHVFVQAYGNAELYVSRRSPTGFEVTLRDGDANVEFSYRLVAKRRGFEQARLEQAPGGDQDQSLYPEKEAEKLAAAE